MRSRVAPKSRRGPLLRAFKCTGELTGEEAKQLADFLSRIDVKT